MHGTKHACAYAYPHVYRSEEVSKGRLNKIRGVEQHDRLDAELYQDFETDGQRKVSDHGCGMTCCCTKQYQMHMGPIHPATS